MFNKKLQPIRGTHDLLPEEFSKFQAIVDVARELARLYNFDEMATPIFEATEVFARSMGESSDVVAKEMYSFESKGGDSMTLRPEFTAGIVRAFISNGMQQHLPLKLFSTGPLFRYERPQKGRQRQFHQVNFEWLGDDSVHADIELITLAGHFLRLITGSEKKCTLLINSLGDTASRAAYRQALIDYLTPYTSKLSEDSQRRLTVNPLRILDSKDTNDQKLLENAPVLTDFLSDVSKARLDTICETMSRQEQSMTGHDILQIEVKPTPSLVRGLDYYSETVFEFVSDGGDLGAQNTVLAGGRYDGLVEQMGGKPTPAIGFAAGIERLLLLMSDDLTKTPTMLIHILPLDEKGDYTAQYFATKLRVHLYQAALELSLRQQCRVEVARSGNLKKRLERANKRGATHVIFLGGEEAERGMCKLKNLATGEELEVSITDFEDSKAAKSIFFS